MPSTETLMSELEAVNIILANMGEPGINSLDGVGVDAQMAKDILLEVSREVQNKGFHFNREKHTLSPDLTGTIYLPANLLRVDTIDEDKPTDVVARGLRLFDRVNNTYTFDSAKVVEIYVMLEWNDLPLYAKNFIVIRAARRFAQRLTGSDSISRWNEQDEQRAWADLMASELDNADYNYLYDSHSVGDILIRRPWGFNFLTGLG